MKASDVEKLLLEWLAEVEQYTGPVTLESPGMDAPKSGTDRLLQLAMLVRAGTESVGDRPAKAGGGWVAVDLDGTLAGYEEWKGHEEIGAPVHAMQDRVLNWLNAGIDVRIFTARVAHDEDGTARKVIETWCQEHLGRVIPITNAKDYGMIELWDDRAVQVIPNTGHRADGKP